MTQKNHEIEHFIKALKVIFDSEKSAGEFEIRLRELIDKDYIVFSKHRLPYGE